MSCEDDVIKIGRKLEKMISGGTSDHSSALDLLKKLKDLPMNLHVLQKTRIGMTVNNFRKASNKEEVISLSKSLIKGWKKLLPGDSPQPKSESKKGSGSPNGDAQNSSQESTSSTPSATPTEEKSMDFQNVPKPAAAARSTNDPTRLKCRELLATALKASEAPDGSGHPDDIAANIEDSIFEEFKNTDSKYKNRVRSRVANLRDLKNPQLRENVLLGVIDCARIAKMTAEEMASNEMKEIRAKYTKESINDHQMAKTGGTKSELFKCGKCGKKNTTYTQLQTRSSDEPMTTFVFCNECGNRWKFC